MVFPNDEVVQMAIGAGGGMGVLAEIEDDSFHIFDEDGGYIHEKTYDDLKKYIIEREEEGGYYRAPNGELFKSNVPVHYRKKRTLVIPPEENDNKSSSLNKKPGLFDTYLDKSFE